MTLDGKIATRSGDSRISSQADLARLHTLRAEADAVMVGRGTQLGDDPKLSVRLARGRNPLRIIVDSLCRISPRSKVFSTSGGRTIIAVSEKAPGVRVKKLQREGVTVIRCGNGRSVNLRILVAKLCEMGVRRLLLEGGGRLNWSMLSGKLVDEVRVTVAPAIVGGANATTLVEGPGVRIVPRAIKLKLSKITRYGNEVVLTYLVRN